MEILTFVLVGLFAGLSAGLFGIGGGLITVPAMFFLLPIFHSDVSHLMLTAVATSLAAIVPTAIMSSYGHYKKNAILWPVVLKITPKIFIGAALGAIIAMAATQNVLKTFFAIFLLLVALNMFREAIKDRVEEFRIQSINSFVTAAIGAVSSVMGVGGGTMTVPYLTGKGMNIHNAIACSAVLGVPIALSGSVILYLSHLWENNAGEGYIHFPALFGITLASIVIAPYGAKLAHYLPVKTLKKIFSLLLMIIGLKILIG